MVDRWGDVEGKPLEFKKSFPTIVTCKKLETFPGVAFLGSLNETDLCWNVEGLV